MQVGFSGFHESYISRVTLDPVARSIDVVQTDGPFRRLENHWRFTPRGGSCEVGFAIDFEFKNPLLNMVAGKAFERVMMRMSHAFEARARALSNQAE
jgi:coenzyme Q-binding protein COQ10